MVVENFAMFLAFSNLSATHALRFYRIGSLEPVDHIYVVDMLLGDMVATEPVKVIPVAHLVFHFGLVGFAWTNPYAIIVPPSLCRSDFSD